jgi:hypothetical protein
MFSTTLRKRPEWASVPSSLLSQQTPKWKGKWCNSNVTTKLLLIDSEQSLQTHDLAIPLPRQGQMQDFFHIILLSCADMRKPEEYMSRIERLYHHTGGKDIGIVFLIRDEHSQENGTRALMNLQIKYFLSASFCERDY